MKSSEIGRQSSDEDEDERDHKDPTPTGPPARPGVAERHTSARPRLLHSPPVRLSEFPRTALEQESRRSAPPKTGDKHGATPISDAGAPVGDEQNRAEEERLAKMREAVNAKLAVQQRTRNSYGAKRVSPIREEDSIISPSLNAAFASPIEMATRPLSSVSTDSTESARTVRASVPPTPAESKPLRTPSYPFPYVPGTPRAWSSSFHQPFTALSPTVTAQHTGDQDARGSLSRQSSMLSNATTPGATTNDFLPPGAASQRQEDPRFPTPNLYDTVLMLNAEPGLEQWWATVTNLMHDNFKADRVTLIMPLDPTDIENVPWGQKATFSMNGREEFVPHRTVLEQTSHVARPDVTLREPSTDAPKDFRMQKLHPERLRPRLESRHSYAGPGRDPQAMTAEIPARPGARPAGPQRTVTHASGVPGGMGPGKDPPQRLPSTTSFWHTSFSDPDFSSIAGGVDAGPYAEVFPTLKALHHEVRPLIEPSGVDRVLERGRVVTVTRDYASERSDSSNANSSAAAPGDIGGPTPKDVPSAAAAKMLGNYRSALASENAPGRPRDYEEYEQYPTSPWAQSPAPSPAIQADEEDNPFFASTEEQQVEDSFNPTTVTPKDYSQYGQVEAIGVDHASTVIHIPLVHPTLSQPMQSLRMRQTGEHSGSHRSNTMDNERKAPIAILSVLSSTVPYPPNWTQSLKLLGPHLATSFATAQQFSSSHVQAVTIRHRRTASGHHVGDAPMTIEPASLEDIMNAELEGPPGSNPVSGSLTSPSEYSSRSKHSPTSSLAGTPGWDPATHGWTSSKSVTGTPAFTGSEMVDNYFEAKKRSTPRSASNTTTATHATPAKQASKAQVQEGQPSARRQSPPGKDEGKAAHAEQKLKPNRSVKEEVSPLRQITDRAESPTPRADTKPPQRPIMRHSISHFADQNAAHAARRHSLLHSYGADLESSFGGLPSQVGLDPVASGPPGHARKASYPEDMPPPSERLLRTIIDSVPVQIFTAKPDTGQLSWVNSKWLIYRGQEPRQALSEPWQAIHPDDRVAFMASWHRSLRTALQLQQKVRLERFDGSFRWFYVRAAPLKDKRQKIVHWIGTMMDFHEQHLAELNAARQQETAASEAKYRALANSSPQIVFAVSKNGVTFCNSQWLHFSGQTEAQALGVGFMNHVHPDDLAKCRLPTFDDESKQPTNVPTSMSTDSKRAYSTSDASSGSSETERGNGSESSPVAAQMPQRKLSGLTSTGILRVARDADGRPSYSTEVRLKSKDGGFRWHLVRVLLAEPLLQQSVNEEETWYGTCTDINDHKTLERDLKATMDEKSRFLSNMSHEIRTPLNGITGMVNFLIDSSLTSEQMEHVNIIRASTEGLRGLINDILDLSKAEAGMIQLNMDWLYIRAIIEEVNDLTSAMAIDKGLELNYVVDANVPSQVRGDRFRIRQVLLNVVGNAIKFTDRGEVFVRCSIQNKGPEELEKNEMYIKFEVVDTGRGFTDQEAEYLFKRFSQIDGSSTRQHGGTGLGLVISKQLAQLHGGDMSAKGVPGKGSTFTLYIKTTLPSKHDQPPLPPPTPGPASIPILPSPQSSDASTPMPVLAKTPSIPMPHDKPVRASPKYLTDTTQSPSPYMSPDGRGSPATSSSSSDPSLMSAARTSSLRSERSSASSYLPDPAFSSPHMKLALPVEPRDSGSEPPSSDTSAPRQSDITAKGLVVPPTFGMVSPGSSTAPPMYSILVICPLKYSREATVQHIDMTLPKNIPHQITARESLLECQKMLGGDDPIVFSHIVLMLQDVEEIITLLDQIFSSHAHSTTSVVIITDLAQKRVLMEQAPKYDYDQLASERRLRFVFKPLKPSRFAAIFDPQKEREMSTDRNQDSAQQVALTQKQVFEELGKRLGNRDKRVLLVEDNKVNQMVILKFLAKVSIPAETAMDGVQCTDKVFAQDHGYYSVILCDLHMPNKDGYQTCKEIRKWEKKNKYPQHIPIIALSANVLGDVYQKCVEAGFNSYMTKPVDFKELSTVLMAFMDPSDPNKPHEFMKLKKGQSHPSR
ncbi:hypothetical protein LTR36_008691 [Oleoguttula mirabilis]|uniref:histidine kinase n=1 Tax=Oleoguttula mirabilis TaxID=1507867 RepID=A0AAV9JTR7_9PEZI|nr:hypothetical protein LTR36_008691 [Oleoguttula mirabilis]